ncbi:MAG: DMT family transporter [Chloroflexota bacterium]|nr:DMT family transporter [Chloroflexota bacterium]
MTSRVAAAYVIQCVVWGTTWAAIKVGVTDVAPWTFALARSILVAVFLGAVALAFRMPFPRGRRTILAAALTGGFNAGTSWAIIFWAEQFVPSGLVAVFGATSPIWTALLAHFLVRHDRLSVVKILALASGFGGIIVLVGASGQISAGPALLATGLLALMTLGWAVAGIVMARTLTTVHPIPTVALGTATGAIVLVPLVLVEVATARPVAWTPSAIAAVLYLALIGSGVGLVVNLWLYRRLRPTTIALAQLLITVEAVALGALALREHITAGMVVGAVLVLTAVALNARAGRARPPSGPVGGQVVATPAD